MSYKIYQYNYDENKYFICLYESIAAYGDCVNGMQLSKNKETNEWRLIYHISRDKRSFEQYYHGTNKTINNLDNIIITHLLGVLDII